MTTALKHPLIPDQATRLRELARAQQTRAYTIAITSGKGGVGKTNIAVNLAICLAGQGLRVTLVDLDMGLANADVLMNLQTRYNLSHVVAGVRTLAEITTPCPGGIDFVPGGSGFEQLADLSAFEREQLAGALHALDFSTDIVVLDCGAGISRSVVTFAAQADCSIIVTTPEPTAMTDAYATIKVTRRAASEARLRLLVNQASGRAEARRVFDRVAGVAEKFLNCPIANAGYVLQDTHVPLAVRERMPFVLKFPRCTASACMAAVAAELARCRGPHLEKTGFFKRVAGLFV